MFDGMCDCCVSRRIVSVLASRMDDTDSSHPENWATRPEVQQLLADILASPHADHAAAVGVQLESTLLDAHVAGLFRFVVKPRLPSVFGSLSSDSAVALHCLLYHLLRSEHNLCPPPVGETTRDDIKACQTGRYQAVALETVFFSALSKAKSKSKKGDSSALLALRAKPFDPSTHANLLLPNARRGKQGATGSKQVAANPNPTPNDPTEAELRRRAACCLALAMGTHGRLGIESAVHLLVGEHDVFRSIAELSGIRTTAWVARPMPKEVPTLRRNLTLEHALRLKSEGERDDERVRRRALERERD